MLKMSYNTLIVASLVLVMHLHFNVVYASSSSNTKRANGVKKLGNSKISSANAFDFEKDLESDNDAYVYSYAKPRSLGMHQYNMGSDSCQLNIECKG